MLMSFKLADMVNIALDEGNYFRSEEWCKQNGSKMMVEHQQEDWNKQLFEGYSDLRNLEKNYAESHQDDEVKLHSQKLAPLVKFFKTLKHQTPALKRKPQYADHGVQTE